MTQEAALKTRYAGMDTDALLALWQGQERMDWAEALLAEELQARGVELQRLQELAAARDPDGASSVSAAVGAPTGLAYFFLIRMGAVALAFAAERTVGSLYGETWAKLALLAVLLGYVVLGSWQVWRRTRRPMGDASAFGTAYQTIELGVLALALMAGLGWAFSQIPEGEPERPAQPVGAPSLMDP